MTVQIMIQILRQIGWKIIGHSNELRKPCLRTRARGFGFDRVHAHRRPVWQINSIWQHDFTLGNFADTGNGSGVVRRIRAEAFERLSTVAAAARVLAGVRSSLSEPDAVSSWPRRAFCHQPTLRENRAARRKLSYRCRSSRISHSLERHRCNPPEA